MWPEDRHQRIRDRLAAYGRVNIDGLTEEFDVSRETIRRDLMEMELAGILRRVRGGALPVTREDTTFGIRIGLRLAEKRAIALKVLGMLSSGMTIFMDAGSTSTVMAEILAEPNGLTGINILTNAVDVARTLSERQGEHSRRFRVLMLAGEFKREPLETFGAATINDIHRYRADIALLAPWGIDAKMGAMNYFIHGAEIARAMVRNAERTIIMADHSKVGAPARSVFCTPDEIDNLVVDAKAQSKPGFDELVDAIPGLIIADG